MTRRSVWVPSHNVLTLNLGGAETIVDVQADCRGRMEPVFRKKERRGKFRACAATIGNSWISLAARRSVRENPDHPGEIAAGTDQGRDR